MAQPSLDWRPFIYLHKTTTPPLPRDQVFWEIHLPVSSPGDAFSPESAQRVRLSVSRRQGTVAGVLAGGDARYPLVEGQHFPYRRQTAPPSTTTNLTLR